jgi:uncharacterized Zn-finger protein
MRAKPIDGQTANKNLLTLFAPRAVKYAHDRFRVIQNRIHQGDCIVTHPTDAADSSLASANTEMEYEIRRADLPLSCPTPEQKLWNSHPRVYLPIEQSGTATCPYCSARYRLID